MYNPSAPPLQERSNPPFYVPIHPMDVRSRDRDYQFSVQKVKHVFDNKGFQLTYNPHQKIFTVLNSQQEKMENLPLIFKGTYFRRWVPCFLVKKNALENLQFKLIRPEDHIFSYFITEAQDF